MGCKRGEGEVGGELRCFDHDNGFPNVRTLWMQPKRQERARRTSLTMEALRSSGRPGAVSSVAAKRPQSGWERSAQQLPSVAMKETGVVRWTVGMCEASHTFAACPRTAIVSDDLQLVARRQRPLLLLVQVNHRVHPRQQLLARPLLGLGPCLEVAVQQEAAPPDNRGARALPEAVPARRAVARHKLGLGRCLLLPLLLLLRLLLLPLLLRLLLPLLVLLLLRLLLLLLPLLLLRLLLLCLLRLLRLLLLLLLLLLLPGAGLQQADKGCVGLD